MARPPNQRIAGRKARELLARTIRGTRRATLRAHLERAERIGDSIWRRWQVGPFQWQVKHLRWHLETQTGELAPGTRYRYWLTARALVCALGCEADWLPLLNGPWVRPTGKAGALGVGRPAKLPLPVAGLKRRDQVPPS